ncbi:MAG: UvrD-helicase domain-containing protein [Planctomycetes bacterium]|nr:UvrD-helicase domain-containing protein [Planctomycetota bacterium]
MDANVEALLADLSEPQRAAVTHTEGPLLILAGPGSGKTRVVTRRAAYLASTVTSPDHILAVTFTNKAAGEMRERIGALGVGRGMTVSTFHALGARLLRTYHEQAGVPPNFTIFDTADRRKVIKEAVERCDLASGNWAPAMVEREISLAKSAMQTAEEYTCAASDWRQSTIARIFNAYEVLLGEMGGLDFDDLLMRVALMLARDGALRDELEDRFRYVLIDEYQDTNAAQYRIAGLLTQQRHNLCATGDPDQSIYGWRGADIGNILSFDEDHPDASVVRLEQNYRSTKRILAAANSLISANTQRKEKTLWTHNDDGARLRVVEFERSDDEARWLAAELARLQRDGGSLDDAAVFYRVNSLSRVLEEALLREPVAYQIARGVEFYQRKEIKDVLAYLRVLVNPSDEIALLRIINTPARGIGGTTISRLKEHARASGLRLFDTVTGGGDLTALGRSAGKVREFGQLLVELSKVLDWPVAKAIEYVVSHSGLRAHYNAVPDSDGAPIGNIDELISAAADFRSEHAEEATVLDWLEHAALLSDVDSVKSDTGAVTLMTLHAAKGLEFDVVYIVGLEEGLLPMRRHDTPDGEDDEEERRLCFVGITRAKRRVTLSRARYRMLRGVSQRTVRSPFLDELPRDEVEWISAEGTLSHRGPVPWRRTGVSTRRDGNDKGVPGDIDLWDVGTLVRHPLHGLGRVMSLLRGPKRTHVDVQFQNGPRLSWVLEFAELTRVDFDELD